MRHSMQSSLLGAPISCRRPNLRFSSLRRSSQIATASQTTPPQTLSSKCSTHSCSGQSNPRRAFLGRSSVQQAPSKAETWKLKAASGYGADDLDAKRRNRLPPTLFMRVLAAFFYVVPWLDILSLGWEYHRRFPTSIIFLTTVDRLIGVYYSSQFAPLIIFFLLFLSVVKNFRIHHFTRFHCMQSIVLDIVTMLFTLVRTYFPGEIRWSPVMNWFDMYAYNMCMCTIIYCIACALLGYYANVTFVSESTYMQVEEG